MGTTYNWILSRWAMIGYNLVSGWNSSWNEATCPGELTPRTTHGHTAGEEELSEGQGNDVYPAGAGLRGVTLTSHTVHLPPPEGPCTWFNVLLFLSWNFK